MTASSHFSLAYSTVKYVTEACFLHQQSSPTLGLLDCRVLLSVSSVLFPFLFFAYIMRTTPLLLLTSSHSKRGDDGLSSYTLTSLACNFHHDLSSVPAYRHPLSHPISGSKGWAWWWHERGPFGIYRFRLICPNGLGCRGASLRVLCCG